MRFEGVALLAAGNPVHMEREKERNAAARVNDHRNYHEALPVLFIMHATNQSRPTRGTERKAGDWVINISRRLVALHDPGGTSDTLAVLDPSTFQWTKVAPGHKNLRPTIERRGLEYVVVRFETSGVVKVPLLSWSSRFLIMRFPSSGLAV